MQLDWQIKTFLYQTRKGFGNRNSKEEDSSSPKRLFRFANEMPFVCIIQVMMSLHNPPALQRYVCKWNYSRLPSSSLFRILGITTFQDIFQNPVDFSHKKGFCDMSSFWYTIFSGERKKSKVVFLLRSLIPKLCMELIRN